MGFYYGGTVVSKGVYWDPVDGYNVSIKEQGILPEDGGRRYLKISSGGLLLISPIIAMVFILFLPLFGIGILLSLIAIPLIKLSFEVMASAVRVCSGSHPIKVVHKWNFSGNLHRSGSGLSVYKRRKLARKSNNKK